MFSFGNYWKIEISFQKLEYRIFIFSDSDLKIEMISLVKQ